MSDLRLMEGDDMATTSRPTEPVQPVSLLPNAGYLRLWQIVGRAPTAKHAGAPALVPVCASTLWSWVRTGKFPPPEKLSPGVTAWPASSIRAWLAARAADPTRTASGTRLD